MKNALITAATKGIGRATAIAFANEDINLAICSRKADELLAFKNELLQINPAIKVVTAAIDASNKEELLRFAVSAERELGLISIIVNNLGMYAGSQILNDADDTLEKMINTNLVPAYELYRYFGKTMITAGYGHIFTICSVAAINPVVEA